MGSDSGASGSSTVTQKADPWSGQQPYLKQGFNDISTFFNQPADPSQLSSLQSQLSNLQAQSAAWKPATTSSSPTFYNSPGSGSTNTTGGVMAGSGASQNPYTSQIATLQAQIAAAQDPTKQALNYGALPQYYPGQTLASQSPYTQQAIQQLANTANSSQQQNLSNAATQQVTDTLNGKYLNPTQDPGFQQALDDAKQAYSAGTAAQTDAAFNNSGSYGGSAYKETKQTQNKAYADSLNTIAGNMYDQARTNQLQAAALAPGAQNLSYTNIGQLANAGSAQDSYNQNQINSDIARYNYNSNLPLTTLQDYMSMIQGNYGGTTTTSTPYQGSTLGQNLGLGISALNAGNSLYSSGALNSLWGNASNLFGSGSAGSNAASDLSNFGSYFNS